MSSGNPFRAPLARNPASSSPVPQASTIAPTAREDGRSGLEDPAAAPPPRTKKHVRIQSNNTYIPSPHPDPDDVDDAPPGSRILRPEQSEHASSLPPAILSSLPDSDTVVGASSTQENWPVYGMATTQSPPGLSRAYQAPSSATLPSGVSANPFARTLASMEPQERGMDEDRTSAERAAPGNNRASLDVESFKNLLLTGRPGPRPSGSPSQSAAPPSAFGGLQFESSSTDTSSISRQSTFEPPQEMQAESPRTSYEMPDSDEDESMGLVSEVRKGKKKPPPAPKHRHGKLVIPRQPQTVSFDSFAASEPAPSPVTQPRDSSDVNKPLPPTPVISAPPMHISSHDVSQQRPAPLQQRSSESIPTPDVPPPQKRVPPPLPLARRQSQLRNSTAGNRSRSNSSLTISSQHSTEATIPSPVPSNKDAQSTPKPPPPPPRSRHGVRLTDISSSSTSSSNSELQRSNSVRIATPTQGPTLSRRSTMDSEPTAPVPGVQRTSSISSNRNSARVVSNETNISSNPPPLPPPRRRQSNRSSLDQPRPHISSSPTQSRRTSTEHRRTSIDNNRRTSVTSESSLRREFAPSDDKAGNEHALYSPQEESENRLATTASLVETRSDSNNILDDMDKFQREIDELVQRSKQAK